MPSHSEAWTIGVEEEYQIINPLTRALYADAESILEHVEMPAGITVHPELLRSQIEIATPVCQTLDEVRATLLQARHAIIAAASSARLWIAASGTHPFTPWQQQRWTQTPRYIAMVQQYQQLAREQMIFGCHVHVSCHDREFALHIMNRARMWLGPLLALAANSPFWAGVDTGYASFRTAIWSRWPMAGPPRFFQSFADYSELIETLHRTGSIEDTSHLYWDMRLSDHAPTIEFRIMDVCLTVAETTMLAGLIRALVQTCARQAQQQVPVAQVPTEVLRAAHWRAARFGLDEELMDVEAGVRVPAHELIGRLLELLRPVLEERGEWAMVAAQVHATLRDGTGAARQRAVYQQCGQLEDVVDFVVAETAKE